MTDCVGCKGKGWVDSKYKGAMRCPICQTVPSREKAQELLNRSRLGVEIHKACEHKDGTIGQKLFDQSVGAVTVLEELLESEQHIAKLALKELVGK